MNFRTTLFLFILVIAIGVTLYFTTGKGDKEKTDKTEAHKLLDIKSADVTKVSITNADGGQIVMRKTGGNWMIEQPVSARAKGFEVDGLVSSLVGLDARAKLDASKKTSGGLDHPSFIVELTTTGDKTTKLSFGESSPVGDSLYVLVDDKANPEIVGNSIYATLDKPVSTYRDMALVTASSSDIRQLEIVEKGKTTKLEKSEEGWKIVEPVKIAADPIAISDYLSSLTTLNATEYVDSPTRSVKNSLAFPRLAVSFSTVPPSTQPATSKPAEDALLPGAQTIRFGSYQDTLKQNMFVSVNGTEVAVVSATSEKPFEKTALDLRTKDVATIDPELVDKFSVAISMPAPAVAGPPLPPDLVRSPTTQPSNATTQPSATTAPATTQPTTMPVSLPTTMPAEIRKFTIERHHVATTQPDASTTKPSVATTQPTTQPAVATTEPMTKPAVATTQPVDELATAKWVFVSGGTGRADEGQVQDLLASLHPLHAEKFVEASAETGKTYTLTIHAVPAKAADAAQDYVFTFIETPKSVIGFYKDLQFEVERGLLEKLNGDFKTKKAAPPQPSSPPMSFPGGRMPFGPGGE